MGTALHILYASVLFMNIFFQLILNLVPILYFMILIANFGTVLQLKFMCTYLIPTTQKEVLRKRNVLFKGLYGIYIVAFVVALIPIPGYGCLCSTEKEYIYPVGFNFLLFLIIL